MATPAETSRAAQVAVAAAAARLALKALPDVDPANIPATLSPLKLAVAAAVQRYGQAAGAAAVQFYLAQRRDAGILGRTSLRIAPGPKPVQVAKSVDWATQPLWGQTDETAAGTRLNAVVEQFVLDIGRDTVIDAVHEDKKALGWARITEPNPCYFCALLASRGAVYRSPQRADFKAHDHDRCHVEPVFNAYEPSAKVREWQSMYEGLDDRSLAGFRAAYEANGT